MDDTPIACKAVGLLLQIAGHEVRVAFNGATALDIAVEFQPDVVILDIKLPDIDGYELLQCFKQMERLRDSKFIALSGYEEDTRRRDPSMDFHHFLTKPVDPQALAALLVSSD